MDRGQGVRQVPVPGHRQGGAGDPENQREQRAERGHGGAHRARPAEVAEGTINEALLLVKGDPVRDP
ncbi:hypothetical protein KN815_15060 [Streptomyces sp. 4503]|uniref:Uncharacterized protein n=1 Tax=Streptomyces niphimycinicus TaxID=2842201 RepID=A0ABS6CEJ5_9ACTN|nr:hypothetical protein [Streptomyces niphimycinicus]MBU3865341.1 hypothetical protein [Streptomyces niphimycinicus]